jgi:hypothetical protein
MSGTVREPADVAISWYNFLKAKNVPPLRKYWAEGGGGVSAFVHDAAFFAEDMRFGGPVWAYYREFTACLSDPSVLCLVFEDMQKDLRPMPVDILRAQFEQPS